MGTLRIHLLGSFRLFQDLAAQETRVIPNTQVLLALLLIHRDKMHSRERIASLLWEESSQEHAHSCLNTAVWRLRKVLEPQGVPSGTYLISAPNGDLGFNFACDCWVDIIEFEKMVQHITTIAYESVSAGDVQQLEQAVAMYKGDLLEGCYSDWILIERERLHMAYMDSLYYLLSFYQFHKQFTTAIRWGQQILRADPLREDVHRDLMQLYAANGQRTLAVRQYQNCRKILEAELHIEPMPETQMVYFQLLGKTSTKFSRRDDHVPLDDTMDKLHSVLGYICQAQKDLQEILARLDK